MFIFLPLYENFVLPFFVFFCLFLPFFSFLAFDAVFTCQTTGELPLKWKKVTSSIVKKMSPWNFFLPLGLNYSPRFARA